MVAGRTLAMTGRPRWCFLAQPFGDGANGVLRAGLHGLVGHDLESGSRQRVEINAEEVLLLTSFLPGAQRMWTFASLSPVV